MHLKKAFLDDIIERIEIGADGTVDIMFRLPNPAATSPSDVVSSMTESRYVPQRDKLTSVSGVLPLGLTLSADFDEWWEGIYQEAKRRFPDWLRELGRPWAHNGRLGPNGLQKATGLPNRVCQNYLYYGVMPSRRNAEIICQAFGVTVDDMVKALGVNVDADMFFRIVEYRETYNRELTKAAGGQD